MKRSARRDEEGCENARMEVEEGNGREENGSRRYQVKLYGERRGCSEYLP